MSVLDKVRRWIDGDTSELVLEEAARDAQVKPRSRAEEFIVKIARAVEEVMQSEMVPLPQGTTIIPSEYTIFLSGEDDKEWQGVKRKGLEQGLYHILAERAKEIAGKKKLETKSFVIELRIDGTLEKGEVRVQHSWEESSSNKTGVLTRPKSLPSIPPVSEKPIPSTNPEFKAPPQYRAPAEPVSTPPPPYSPPVESAPPPQFKTQQHEAPATLPQASLPSGFSQPYSTQPPQVTPQPSISRVTPTPPPSEDSEEMTRVKNRVSELYRLEIWRGGVRQNVVPIYQNEIVIGRGSKSKPVDIPLSGDVEISRRHLMLVTDGSGNFWVVNEGRNPAAINNFELPAGQRISVAPGTPLNVCSYMLRIQPK